jgi:hypothetical protein
LVNALVKEKMRWASHGRKCMKIFRGKTCEDLEELRVDGKIIIKQVIRKHRLRGCGLNSSVQGPLA